MAFEAVDEVKGVYQSQVCISLVDGQCCRRGGCNCLPLNDATLTAVCYFPTSYRLTVALTASFELWLLFSINTS